MRISNDNFIVKHSQALLREGHALSLLRFSYSPIYLRVSLLDFRNSISSRTDGREIVRYAYISSKIIRRYRHFTQERETGWSLLFPLLSPVRSFESSDGNETFLLVISRTWHVIGGISFRLRIYQHTRGI